MVLNGLVKTLTHTIQSFYNNKKDTFQKHHAKRRKCWQATFSPFSTVFSSRSKTDSNLESVGCTPHARQFRWFPQSNVELSSFHSKYGVIVEVGDLKHVTELRSWKKFRIYSNLKTGRFEVFIMKQGLVPACYALFW